MSAGPREYGAPKARPAASRFRARAGGIAAMEAFSRGDALDRDWMGWGALRVLSLQAWAPGAARDEGRVANMERLLLVLEGALDADCGALGRHRAVAGEALWLGCGHGLQSRLANASADAPLRLLECWLQPERVNAAPAVALRAAPDAEAVAGWHGLLPPRLRARIDVARIGAGEALDVPRAASGRCWLEVLEGELEADGHGRLGVGDGLAWTAGAPGAPGRLAATGDVQARALLLALPA